MAAFAAAVVVALQLVRPARTNPAPDRWPDAVERTAMPPEVAALLQRACADCHTHRTRWPWYSHVAPVSWFVIDHVDHAREHLNFSTWPPSDAERAAEMPRHVCREVREGRMPLRSYRMLHPEARLEAADVNAICRWAD